MKISIAMATYNGATFLEDQLQSFLDQKRQPDELIITDDGSTDETLQIIRWYADQAPFEVDWKQNSQNLGYAKNFEKAISLCSGHLIFLSDQDDVWFNNKIEIMEKIMSENPDMLVGINDTEITDGDLNPLGIRKSRQVLNLGLSINSFITGCCTVFRSDIKPVFSPVPTDFFVHDTWLHRLALLLDSRIFVNQTLQYYRRYEENTSNWIGSSRKKVGRLDLIHAYAGKDPKYWCDRRLASLSVTKSRIKERRAFLKNDLGFRSNVKTALAKIESEESAVRRRFELLGLPRFKRYKSAIGMALAGQYQHFSGWKSFLKDLMWQ